MTYARMLYTSSERHARLQLQQMVLGPLLDED